MTVYLQKPVEMQVWYKNPLDGEWRVRVLRAMKHETDITRVITDTWAIMDEADATSVPTPMDIIQPNWAGTGEDVELLTYRPFEAITVDWTHVARNAQNGTEG